MNPHKPEVEIKKIVTLNMNKTNFQPNLAEKKTKRYDLSIKKST